LKAPPIGADGFIDVDKLFADQPMSEDDVDITHMDITIDGSDSGGDNSSEAEEEVDVSSDSPRSPSPQSAVGSPSSIPVTPIAHTDPIPVDFSPPHELVFPATPSSPKESKHSQTQASAKKAKARPASELFSSLHVSPLSTQRYQADSKAYHESPSFDAGKAYSIG
jgi:hypothetical protein